MGKINNLAGLLDMSPDELHLFAAEADIDDLEKIRRELLTRRKKILDEFFEDSESMEEIKKSIEGYIGSCEYSRELYDAAMKAASALLAGAPFGLMDSIITFHYKVRTGTHELENPLDGCSDFIKSLYDK